MSGQDSERELSLAKRRAAIVHVDGEEVTLPQAQPDAQHVDRGGMKAAWAPAWTSRDGMLDAGFWEFAGAMEGGPIDGFELVVTVLEGSGQILAEDGTELCAFKAGDVVIYDAPMPRKLVRSDGFRAVYVQRFRTEDARRELRPDQPSS
jgi:uncharacterized cupin superfamily protein